MCSRCRNSKEACGERNPNGYRIETVPISDIPMRSDESLQSYHQDKWPSKATEYRIDDGRMEYIPQFEYIRGKRDKEGKLRIADGNHRLRAIANSGYDSVEMPVYNEGVEELFVRKI